MVDPELASIFRAESEENLKVLTEGFLALEEGGESPDRLEDMFRAAHRFKGSARVVGAEGLEAVAHRLEDLLVTLRSGTKSLSRSQHDRLSALMDRLGELLLLALEGRDRGAPAEALLASLEGCLAEEEEPAPDMNEGDRPVASRLLRPPRAPHVVTGPGRVTTSEAKAPPPAREPDAGPSSRPFSIDTLRVPTRRLDDLLNLAGELLVSHQRLKRRSEEAERHLEQLEDLLHREGPPDGPWEGVASRAQGLVQGLREDEHRLDSLLGALEDAIRHIRVVPLSRLLDQTPKWVRDMARQTGKEASLDVRGGGIEVDKRILEGLKDPLIHLLRNAIDHGLETPEERRQAGKPGMGLIRVEALARGDQVTLTVADDGRGVDLDAVRRILIERGCMEASQVATLGREALLRHLFLPGFSTRTVTGPLSGRGVGLDVVRTQLEAMKGEIALSSEAGRGTWITLRLPLSLASTRVLLVEVQHMRLGVPAADVQCCLQLQPSQRFPAEGRECFLLEGQPVLLLPMAEVLGGTSRGAPGKENPLVVVLQHLGRRVGLRVEGLLGEQEVLQKPLSPRLKTLGVLSGAALLGDGGLCLTLHTSELMARAEGLPALAQAVAEPAVPAVPHRRILLADDSITTRIQLRMILEAAGFEVVLSVDGLDAWTKLNAQPFDALVSDVDMPGLDGFGLTERIRSTEPFTRLPVVLVTSLSQPEQQRRGLEAGANAYLLKARFDQSELIDVLNRLL